MSAYGSGLRLDALPTLTRWQSTLREVFALAQLYSISRSTTTRILTCFEPHLASGASSNLHSPLRYSGQLTACIGFTHGSELAAILLTPTWCDGVASCGEVYAVEHYFAQGTITH
jgi:hypothetical protein